MAQDLQPKDIQPRDSQPGDVERSGMGAVEGLLERIERPAALADGQGGIVAANGAFCRRSGLDLEALRQRGLQGLCAAEVAPLLLGGATTLSSELVVSPEADGAIPLSLTRLSASGGTEGGWCLLELLDQRVTRLTWMIWSRPGTEMVPCCCICRCCSSTWCGAGWASPPARP